MKKSISIAIGCVLLFLVVMVTVASLRWLRDELGDLAWIVIVVIAWFPALASLFGWEKWKKMKASTEDALYFVVFLAIMGAITSWGKELGGLAKLGGTFLLGIPMFLWFMAILYKHQRR